MKGKAVSPYSDPAIIAKCLNPKLADFPSLRRMWNARTINSAGAQVCPFSGMTISFAAAGDPAAVWTAADAYSFYNPVSYSHVEGELGGNLYNPGTKNFALIASFYGPSGAADGSNALLVFGNQTAGPGVRMNGAYAASGTSQAAIASSNNYLRVATNNSFDVTTARNACEATVYRPTDNDIDYYLSDTSGNYFTANKDGASSVGTIAGGIGQFDTYFECNGYGGYATRFRAIYILEFSGSAPSASFMKAASLWMASRSDGALYPGFMSLT